MATSKNTIFHSRGLVGTLVPTFAGAKIYVLFVVAAIFRGCLISIYFGPLAISNAIENAPKIEDIASIHINTKKIVSLDIRKDGWAYLSTGLALGGNLYCPIGTFSYQEVYAQLVPSLTAERGEQYGGVSMQNCHSNTDIFVAYVEVSYLKPIFAKAIQNGIPDSDTRTIEMLSKLVAEMKSWNFQNGEENLDNKNFESITKMKYEAENPPDYEARIRWLDVKVAKYIPVEKIDANARKIASDLELPSRTVRSRKEAFELFSHAGFRYARIAYEGKNYFYFANGRCDFAQGSRINKETGEISTWNLNGNPLER